MSYARNLVQTTEITKYFTTSDEAGKRIQITEINEDLGQNFESYGFTAQNEVVLFNLRDENGKPIIMEGKVSKNQKRPSVLIYCTRINPNGKEKKSWFNLNALVVQDASRTGYGKGYETFYDMGNHKKRAEFIFASQEAMALQCTNVVKRGFTKFVNGAPVQGETEERNYYEYEII